jgi:putative MATE family efflux protein
MKPQKGEQEKFIYMTETPIKKLVIRMAIPTIITMLVIALYNMTDTFFVGQIDTGATAAVGIVFPVMAIMQAIGIFFGNGSGNYISRKLGEQDSEEVSRMVSVGFFSAFGVGILIMVVGLIFLSPLARLLGATDTILPYAEDYMRFIVIAAPFFISSLTLMNQLRLQGNAFYSMIGYAVGVVLNVALDPLFIFTFKMGITGASLATAISQFTALVVLIIGSNRKGGYAPHLTNFSPGLSRYGEIVKGGLPSSSQNVLASIATIALNLAASRYGDVVVAAMSIVTRITLIAGSAFLGLAQGLQPVCGFNYGARRYDRVKAAFWFCVKVATVGLVILSVAGFIFAPSIIAIFREDAEVVAIGAQALRYQFVALPFLGWLFICGMTMQTIGAFMQASVLSMARQGIFFLPLILILPHLLGLTGIQFCQPLADILSFVLALPLGINMIGKINKRKNLTPLETPL